MPERINYKIQSHMAAMACGVADSPLRLYSVLKKCPKPAPFILWPEIEKAAVEHLFPGYMAAPEAHSAMYPWMVANPAFEDRDGERGVIVLWTALWDNGVPEKYMIRAYHDMMVRNWRSAAYLIMDRDGPDCYPEFYYNSATASLIVRREQGFIDQLHNNIPPQPMCDDDLDILYPDGHSGDTEANDATMGLLAILNENRTKIKELEKHSASVRVAVKANIGPATRLMQGCLQLATLKLKQQKRFQLKRLKKENPAVYKEFLADTTSRELRVKWDILP